MNKSGKDGSSKQGKRHPSLRLTPIAAACSAYQQVSKLAHMAVPVACALVRPLARFPNVCLAGRGCFSNMKP